MKRLIAAASAAALLLCGCSAKPLNNAGRLLNGAKTVPAVSEMSLEEKVGQMLLVRCDDKNIDSILSKHPGGIVMFGVDFEGLSETQVKEKIASYQKKSDIPLIIAADEEGGTVVRVSSNPNLSDERFKSPQYYYNEGGLELVLQKEDKKCKMLRSLGINMNLAPVADVSSDPADFIYDRSLGANAETTAQYVAETVKTMKDNGVASCLKHFPGYGSNSDTHTGIAVDGRPRRVFENSDFLPFAAGIDAGADAVLAAHNIVNWIDSSLPASISPAAHELLRSRFGFGGLIITDDMSMDAAAYDEAYIMAVNAGNDMLIVTDYEAAYSEILNGVKNGSIDEDAIDKAAEHIAAHKENMLRQ